jgi:hypothetical protein
VNWFTGRRQKPPTASRPFLHPELCIPPFRRVRIVDQACYIAARAPIWTIADPGGLSGEFPPFLKHAGYPPVSGLSTPGHVRSDAVIRTSVRTTAVSASLQRTDVRLVKPLTSENCQQDEGPSQPSNAPSRLRPTIARALHRSAASRQRWRPPARNPPAIEGPP